MQEEDLRRPPLELPNLKDIKHLVYSINYLRFATLEGSRVFFCWPVFRVPVHFLNYLRFGTLEGSRLVFFCWAVFRAPGQF
jgi:hypothetical protein